MRLVPRLSLAVGLLALGGSSVASQQADQMQEFARTCAYDESTLTDGHHWLRTACLHDMMAVSGYDETCGKYSTSCPKCLLDKEWRLKTMMLKCSCHDSRGTLHTSELDLNTAIQNIHGALACFDHVGNKTVPHP
ncbi:hypothetical protein VTJ49DRAFT_6991 [Mycothermus thermophilus]|uniref:Cyanovirin-N domain-containing protein n=1 Tax=Humicola insolens TaxID=85995 RepID=A0ABR3VHY3_HUMIN